MQKLFACNWGSCGLLNYAAFSQLDGGDYFKIKKEQATKVN